VGVVRNGGPIDNRGIRQIVEPGSGPTWVGWFSQSPHEYPSSRVPGTYTLTADPKRGARAGSDVVTVPTKDGVQVGLQGTVYYRFIAERDHASLTRFDSSIGTRLFASDNATKPLYAWQGDDGWNAMIEAIFRPVLDNNLRSAVGRFQCAEIVSSCKLVHRPTRTSKSKPNATIARIEAAINRSLESDLTGTLSRRYFWGVRFRIARVTLPAAVQAAINTAHASYAGVADAKALATQAKYQNRRNRLLAKTYDKSPALANIEAMKAVPKGSTVILSGPGQTPRVIAGAGGG
jgi:hypothetical protein